MKLFMNEAIAEVMISQRMRGRAARLSGLEVAPSRWMKSRTNCRIGGSAKSAAADDAGLVSRLHWLLVSQSACLSSDDPARDRTRT
jgi:hypothetical protein